MNQEQDKKLFIPPLNPGEVLVEELRAGQKLRIGNVIYKVITVRPNGKATIKPTRVMLNAVTP